MSELDILIFAPHPDDAEIGMAGSILLWAKEGARIGIVDLTRGELGTKGDVESRAQEAEEASRLLGLALRENLDLGDGRLIDDESNREKIANRIRMHRPRVVFVTPDFDRHPDHEAANKLVKAAFFLARLPKYHGDERAHSVNAWYNYFIHDMHRVSFVVDITSVWAQKVEVLKAYRSQFVEGEVPDGYRYVGTSDYLRQLEAYSQYLGAKIGVERGEGFYAPAPLKVRNVLDIIP
ncbi:MAG TPA: bacillithiol biosynthesis deacetylase BshB1 [bacterium]|nr:bacillithiol biosynthesis deacetylase BshB1 [bacterium]HQP99905.1 bacillithiol biosynthesis deacetylase BshB1 [bacterium]